jgi:hypothetical protein
VAGAGNFGSEYITRATGGVGKIGGKHWVESSVDVVTGRTTPLTDKVPRAINPEWSLALNTGV